MTRLLAFLVLMLGAAAAQAADCIQPAAWPCSIAKIDDLTLAPGINEVSRTITVPPAALPLERPLTVRVAALASWEVIWNGRRIGGNGVPGTNRASEQPGRYFATVTIPPALVRPGDNRVTIRMSAEHLWLPVRRPVHMLLIGPYETPQLPGRSHYLPALLALGAIAAAFVYFAAAALGRGRGPDRTPLLLAGVAGTTLVQLLLEVSRAFVAYSYPLHLARVSAIAAVAAATAMLVAAYAANRFAPAAQRSAVLLTAAAAAASIVLLPAFDFKAMGAILAGAAALGLAALRGLRRREAEARWAAAASLAVPLLMAWQGTAFLDQAYYLLVAVLLIVLVAEQVGALRAARAEALRAVLLEERLRKAEEAGESIVQLKDGSRVHRVAQSDILYARGADDYCEVRLKDGRHLLVTTGLARLQDVLPGSFIRVHKSYVVNGDHVRRLEPRPGGGRQIRLDAGVTVPVGRTYNAVVAAWAG